MTYSEVQQVSAMKVLIRLKVYPAASPTRRRGKKSLLIRRDATPEGFPNGSPVSVRSDFCNYQVYSRGINPARIRRDRLAALIGRGEGQGE